MMGKPKPDMRTKARDHARVAARQSTMKGIDPSDAGVALMAEALCLIYKIELLPAMLLVKQLLPHPYDILLQQLTEQRPCTETPGTVTDFTPGP
jgi:hypothetical protein